MVHKGFDSNGINALDKQTNKQTRTTQTHLHIYTSNDYTHRCAGWKYWNLLYMLLTPDAVFLWDAPCSITATTITTSSTGEE